MIAKALSRAFGAVLLLNVLFLLVALHSASIPSQQVASAARHAFETGALSDDDWLIGNRERGSNQYNDCLIIQLIVNDVSLFDDAMAPVIRNDSTWTGSCATLRGIVVDGKTDPVSIRYTRYWHGYVPIATFLLSAFDLDVARPVLKSLVYLSVLMLVVSALHVPIELRIFAFSVAGAAALFWAVPYYGQSLSHGPGDAFLTLGLAGFLFFSNGMSIRRALLPYSAAYGAGVAYLEFWTGQLPTAAGFLFAAAYLVNVSRERLIAAWLTAGASLLAFLAGAGFTVASKQVLAIMLTDAPVLASFAGKLSHYTGAASSNGIVGEQFGRVSGLLLLVRSSATITYESSAGALGLMIGVMGSWCGAGLLAWHRRSEGPRPISNLLAYITAALVPFVWAVIFPLHTAIHAGYMSRMLILPVALGAAVFLNGANSTDTFRALLESRNRVP
jgi:hypothetical protein